jgi:hypothetical protein
LPGDGKGHREDFRKVFLGVFSGASSTTTPTVSCWDVVGVKADASKSTYLEPFSPSRVTTQKEVFRHSP